MIHSELVVSVPDDNNQSVFPELIKFFLIGMILVASKVPAIGQPLPGSGPKSLSYHE